MKLKIRHLPRLLGAAVLAFFILLPEALPFQVKQGPLTLAVSFRLPKGYEFIAGAPAKLTWTTKNPDVVRFEGIAKKFNPDVTSKILLRAGPGRTVITLEATLFYCDKTTRMCFQKLYTDSITIETGATGPSTILYVWSINPSKAPSA